MPFFLRGRVRRVPVRCLLSGPPFGSCAVTPRQFLRTRKPSIRRARVIARSRSRFRAIFATQYVAFHPARSFLFRSRPRRTRSRTKRPTRTAGAGLLREVDHPNVFSMSYRRLLTTPRRSAPAVVHMNPRHLQNVLKTDQRWTTSDFRPCQCTNWIHAAVQITAAPRIPRVREKCRNGAVMYPNNPRAHQTSY